MSKEPLVAAEAPPQPARRTGSARAVWYVFLGLAAIFALCIAAQVFIAGLAVFVTPAHWAQHTAFVHSFAFVPLLMLVISAIGRLPVHLRWRSATLFALVYAQYFTANIGGLVPLVAALHPVVALVIFWLSVQVVQETRRALVATANAGVQGGAESAGRWSSGGLHGERSRLMRMVIALVVGLTGGFVLGLVFSQVIAMLGLLLVSQPVGIKFLPIYLAIAGAIITPIVAARSERRVP